MCSGIPNFPLLLHFFSPSVLRISNYCVPFHLTSFYFSFPPDLTPFPIVHFSVFWDHCLVCRFLRESLEIKTNVVPKALLPSLAHCLQGDFPKQVPSICYKSPNRKNRRYNEPHYFIPKANNSGWRHVCYFEMGWLCNF